MSLPKEQIWTSEEKYLWMYRRVIKPKEICAKYRKMYPDEVFFESFAECEQWIFETFLKSYDHKIAKGTTPANDQT